MAKRDEVERLAARLMKSANDFYEYKITYEEHRAINGATWDRIHREKLDDRVLAILREVYRR